MGEPVGGPKRSTTAWHSTRCRINDLRGEPPWQSPMSRLAELRGKNFGVKSVGRKKEKKQKQEGLIMWQWEWRMKKEGKKSWVKSLKNGCRLCFGEF